MRRDRRVQPGGDLGLRVLDRLQRRAGASLRRLVGGGATWRLRRLLTHRETETTFHRPPTTLPNLSTLGPTTDRVVRRGLRTAPRLAGTPSPVPEVAERSG